MRAGCLSTVLHVLAYVIAIAIAVAVVKITDGTFTRLAEVTFSRVWLLAVGLGIQVALSVFDLPRARLDDLGVALLLISYVAVLAFCAANIRTRGIAVIGLGIALNAAVIALNLGMPYHVVDGIARETTIKHRPERSTDILPVLSDRFAYGSPLNAAISIGDLVLFAGIIQLAYANSRRARRRPAPTPKRYVDLPAVEREQVIDLREPQPDATPTPAAASEPTMRSRTSKTRGS